MRGLVAKAIALVLLTSLASGRAQAQATPDEVRGGGLVEAASQGNLAMVQQWLAAGAPATKSEMPTALIAAVRRHAFDVARALLEAGANVNSMDETGQSAFLLIAATDNVDMLKLALRKGGLLDSRDRDGNTALMLAARKANNSAIIELLRNGTELNSKNRLGRTALAEAIVGGDGGPRHTDTVRLLVRAGADQALRDNSGLTPMQYARQRDYREMAAVLTSAGGR